MEKIARSVFAPWLLLCLVSCSDSNDPAPAEDKTIVEAILTGSKSSEELKLLIQFSGRDIDPSLFAHDVNIYKVIYRTEYKNSEVFASGLILLPQTTSGTAMISYQHGTLVQQSQAPSVQQDNGLEIISYAALASMGFITVAPDMLGFGEASELFHPYFIEEPTARSVMDFIRAGQLLAKEKQVEFNGKLFLAGYSEGGYATMATHKAIESDPLEGVELIASFPGAGGYDIVAMQQHLFELDHYPDPYYLAYLMLSYQNHYEQPALLKDFFNEPYAREIPSLFNGEKSKGEINAALTTEIETLIKADVRMNFEDAQYTLIREALEENSLLDWTPGRPVFLYHGTADTTIPYQNSQLTYETLISNGAAPENVQLITLAEADHNSAVEPYIEDVIKKLQSLK
jgi:pimeloyl-ACP methyl ester carboxylesterase